MGWAEWGQPKPKVYLCLHCGLEAVLEDGKAKPCTVCKRTVFAERDDYDRLFLLSLKISPMT